MEIHSVDSMTKGLDLRVLRRKTAGSHYFARVEYARRMIRHASHLVSFARLTATVARKTANGTSAPASPFDHAREDMEYSQSIGEVNKCIPSLHPFIIIEASTAI